MTGLRRVEVGGGPHPLRPAYEQFDAIDWSARTGVPYTLGDARALPYPDGSCEIVFASNILEHFPEDETIPVLTEWARVLAPGGTLEIVVPDAMGILADHFRGIDNWTDCAERLRGSMDYPGNQHFRAFTFSTFPQVIAAVSSLELVKVESTHRGGGVHSWSTKRGA